MFDLNWQLASNEKASSITRQLRLLCIHFARVRAAEPIIRICDLVRKEAASRHMWPLSSAEVEQINYPTHLPSVRLHRANSLLPLERGMRGGVGRLAFVAFLFSFLLILYRNHHLQSSPNLECGAGVSEEVLPSFDLPDNVTLASLNTTGRAEVDILFFNRVPKVI